jgi:hypothetical protein
MSMSGFTHTVTHRGEEVEVGPPVLLYAKAYPCCWKDRGCSFSSDNRGPLKRHEMAFCPFAPEEEAVEEEAAETAAAAAAAAEAKAAGKGKLKPLKLLKFCSGAARRTLSDFL